MLKISFYKFRWKTILYIFLSISLLAFILSNLTIDSLDINITKCPSCYGNDVCSQLDTASYNLLFPNNWKLFNIIFNVKNVFFIEIHYIKLIAKKLAHDSELDKFDENLCKETGFEKHCNVSEAIIKLTAKYSNNIDDIVNGAAKIFENTECVKCNQTSTLNYLYSRYIKMDSSKYSLQHFLTILAINPEPIIIQAGFNEFPTPAIFGTCGRLFIESYEGRRLTQFYDTNWIIRAYLSLQLLQLAVSSSENDWKLFILDVSPNNFAVDSSYKVKLIDVENVVILDSTVNGLSDKSYQNDGKGCKDCLSFVYEDLCSHKINDHNYFAICKGLLALSPFTDHMPAGLLHSIPEKVTKQYRNFEHILQECAFPIKMTRKEAAFMLMRILRNITLHKYPL